VTTLHGPGAQGNSLELIQEVLSVGADGAGSFKSHARSPTATETTLQPPRSCGTEDGQVPGQYEYKTVYQAVFRSFVGPAITIAGLRLWEPDGAGGYRSLWSAEATAKGVCAAQGGILMSREVSGGGLAHQGHTPSTSGSVLWPIPSNAIWQQSKTEGCWRFRCRSTDMPFGSRGGGMLPGLGDEQIRWAADLRALDRSRIGCDTLASNAST